MHSKFQSHSYWQSLLLISITNVHFLPVSTTMYICTYVRLCIRTSGCSNTTSCWSCTRRGCGESVHMRVHMRGEVCWGSLHSDEDTADMETTYVHTYIINYIIHYTHLLVSLNFFMSLLACLTDCTLTLFTRVSTSPCGLITSAS